MIIFTVDLSVYYSLDQSMVHKMKNADQCFEKQR